MSGLSERDAVEQYLAQYPRPQVSLKLLERLKCPIVDRLGLIKWSGPAESHSQVSSLRECLPKMLRSRVGERVTRDTTTSLLVGLGANANWSTYPDNEDDAYALAIEVLFCVDAFRSGDGLDNRMDRFSRAHICTLLNKWLKPSVAWTDLPGVVTMCQHMFGEPWCFLALPSQVKDGIGGHHLRSIAMAPDRIVELTRPPFLTGVCRGRAPYASEPLPDDIGIAP